MHLILLSILLPFGLSIQPGCFSEQDGIWNITWPTTMVGDIATQGCPGGKETEGNATRACVDENSWENPNVSQCRSMTLIIQTEDLETIIVATQRLPRVFRRLVSITEAVRTTINTTNPILPNDIPIIVNILETILNIIRRYRRRVRMQRQQAMKVAENCVMILNSMLNERHDDSFEAIIENSQQMSVSERLLRIIERVGILVAFTFDSAQNETQNATFEGSHLVIDAVLVSNEDVMRNRSFTFQRRMQNRRNAPVPGIRIPMRTVRRRFMRERRRIPIVNIFVVNLESRLRNDEGQKIVSTIISSQISDNEDARVNLDGETVELIIDIGMLNITSKINPRCAFWNFTRDGDTGGFSEEGITQGGIIDDNTLSCFSNHLTSFAVLVDATGDNSNSISTPALSTVSYIGCGISIVCLTLSIHLMLIFRKKIFNQVRHFIHVNLSAALLLGLIVFVSGIEIASNSRAGCLTVAILLHYFFLAAFSWMLCEAIVLLIVVEFVFYKGFFKTRKFFTPLGWGLPIPIVAISAAVSHEQYGTNGRCWISEEQGAIWAFLGPMLLIVLINSIVYIMIVYRVFQSKHDAINVDKADTMESVKTSLKAAIILLPLLGVTWVFGLLAVNKHTIAFAWIFTILNSLQGLFIFLFYIVKNKKFSSMLKQHVIRYTGSGTNSSNKPTLSTTQDKTGVL